MTDRRKENEHANAEVLGVVILIGIFAITAGIISATTFATPQPVKVPAASLDITRVSETTFRFAHNGGDPLSLASLYVLGTRVDGSTERLPATDWLEETDGSEVRNGFVGEGSNAPYTAIAVTWSCPAGVSVLDMGPPGRPAVDSRRIPTRGGPTAERATDNDAAARALV